MSEGYWHKHQKSYFNNIEIKICNFRADAVEDNFAFEFQDKHLMTSKEIKEKEEVYNKNNYITIWILNMNRRAIICDNKLLVDNDYINDYINIQQINNQIRTKYIYYSYRNYIYYYKNISKCMNEENFYNSFLLCHQIPSNDSFDITLNDDNYKTELNYIQMGAGSGKTYKLVKKVLENKNKMSILVSKTNIGKYAIFNKFSEILEDNYKIIVNDVVGTVSKKLSRIVYYNDKDKEKAESKKFYIIKFFNEKEKELNSEYIQFDETDDENQELNQELIKIYENNEENQVLNQTNNQELNQTNNIINNQELNQTNNTINNQELNHINNQELNQTNNIINNQELNHIINQELNHTNNIINNQKLNHTNNQELNHINNQELNHSNNQELNQTNNQELNHSNNQELNHSNNQELNHSNNQELNHTINQEFNQTNNTINNQELNRRFTSSNLSTFSTFSNNSNYNNSIIIIATVDSFLYNFISNKSKKELQNNLNIFSYAAESFNKETSKISLAYKNQYIKGAQVYIDEAQDLHYGYKKFFEESAKLFNFNITLIGDILQSIYYENNLYSYVLKDKNWKLLDNEKYICRRFKNKNLMEYVNNHIHNKLKNSLVIPIKQPIIGINVKDNVNFKVIEKSILISYDNKVIQDDKEQIYNFILSNIDKNDILTDKTVINTNANKYVFILPFIKNNNMATYIEVILNEIFGSINVHLFTSENGEPICLNKYNHHAKIISVHASKGESFDTVFVINVQPKIIASVYQKDNNTNSLLCWSMMNVAYTRAINKMYVLNLQDNNSLRFKWFRYNNVKRFILDCITPQQQEELIYIFKKSINYNEILNKIDDNKNNSVIDNNIQVLRYYIIYSLLYLKTFKNANSAKQIGGSGKGEFYGKIYNIIENQLIRCKTSKFFRDNVNKWNNTSFKKDINLPIWNYKKNYPIANKYIDEIYSDITSCNDPLDIYKLLNTYEQKINYKDNKFVNANINKLYLLFVLMKLTSNPYINYEYKTLCELIQKISINNQVNNQVNNYSSNNYNDDIDYLYESNKFITETLPKFHFVGLTSKFKFNSLLSHQFLIYGKSHKKGKNNLFKSDREKEKENIENNLENNENNLENNENNLENNENNFENNENNLENNTKNKINSSTEELNEIDMSELEPENYIIDNPLNQTFNILNFTENCIKSLIEYVILISSNETNKNNKKIIRLYTISNDKDKRLIDFDFRTLLKEDDIEKIKNIINQAIYKKNENLINEIIEYLNNNKNNLQQILEDYIKKYKDYKDDDFVIIFKDVIYLLDLNYSTEQIINEIKRLLLKKLDLKINIK